MTVSLASKRYIVETNLDETVDTGSSDLISASQTTAFSDSVSDDEEKLDDYRKLLSRVGILQQQLKTSGIDIDQFAHVNFSSSQELLAAVCVSIQALEKDIEQTERKYEHSSDLTGQSEKLQAAWKNLNALFNLLKSNFEETNKLWTDFHSLLKIITAWLTKTEKILKRTRDKAGELLLEQARIVQKDLEEGMSQNQSVIHNLARTAIPLASKLTPLDAERITDKVSKVTGRWKNVTVEIRCRKPRVDSMSDSGKCLDVMDDLSFWLEETDLIMNSSPDYTDQQSISDLLSKLKGRRDEIPHKREALEFVSRSAKDLWTLPELGPDDKLKIGRDLEKVNRKWQKVSMGIEARHRHLEESLETLQDIFFDIGRLHGELWQAISDLEPKMEAENFSNIQEIFPGRERLTMETLSIWYREVLLLYKKLNAVLPKNMEAHFRHLTMKWTAVREKSLLHRAGSDSSIEETLATAVSAEDIFEEPRQSVFMNDYLQISKLHSPTFSTALEDGAVPLPPPRVESLTMGAQDMVDCGQTLGSEAESTAVRGQAMNREVTLALLKDRLVILNRTVSNRRVDILDQEEITESEVKVSKLTNAVQEILRELSMYPEADNQVSGLRSECEECLTRSVSRSRELKQLLIDSHRYGDEMAKVDGWLSELEARIDSRRCEAIGDALDVVDTQIQQHLALEAEVKSWKDNYNGLNRMTESLISKYPHEDSRNLKSNAQTLSDRWENVQSFLSERSLTLNSHKQIMKDYDGPLQTFLSWLTEQEAAAEILLEEVKVNDPVRSTTWSLRSKDLQSQIEAHQRQHELLRLTGKKMSKGSDSSLDGEDIAKHLDDMNKRWSQLRAKTLQIRCRLESSMEQWTELLTRCRQLIEYLNSRENALIAARPVSDSLEGVKRQKTDHEEWKLQLESKTSDFELAISTGRFYLEREGADRRLSSASCDSRIMDELTIESPDAKTVIKNIRRHIRLLNQKWLELHNKSDRWSNQLLTAQKNLEAISNLTSLALRELNEVDSSLQSWKPAENILMSDLPRHLTTVRSMRQKNEEVAEQIAKAKAIVRNQDTPVNMETKQLIVRIAERQEKVEKQLSDRDSELVKLNRSLVPEVNDLLQESVSRPYERAITSAGVPYYINHDKKTTQWDHPEMVVLLADLSKFNSTKFSAYRAAQKLRKMQKTLGLSSVRLKDVIRSCQEHKIISSDSEEIIDINLIVTCLRDLFEHLADERHASGVNVPLRIDLTLNWLLNVYDLGRQGKLRAFTFQVGLVIMCRGAVEDKFKYLLSCLGDGSGQIDERKLSHLLSDCIQIPRQLGEASSFGGANVEPSVQSCFEQAKCATSVNSKEFMDWLALEPQSMVWLPVYHRLATSESCKHQAKCSLCKMSPIEGLRYRCLQCFNFNLCQTCFFAGKKGKNHKLNHQMKEYYCSSTSKDEMKDLSSPMRKKYSSGRYIKKYNPKGYLPISKQVDGDSTLSRESKVTDNCTPSSPPSIHIQYDMSSSMSSHDALPSQEASGSAKADSDIHEDIGRYAHTLDRLESQNTNNGNSNQDEISPAEEKTYSNTLPSSKSAPKPNNDEHDIIERYCTSLTGNPSQKSNSHLSLEGSEGHSSAIKSPMQIVMSLEDSQKTELEAMIRDLEDENRNLQSEYQQLQAERDQQPVSHVLTNDDREADMLAEAMLLRQHKGRLEGRMKILEDHNKQLEAQLRRLRHLLEQPNEPVAPEIAAQMPHTSSSNSPLRVKKLPPTYARQANDQELSAGLTSSHRTPKLHGSIGELFQMAGQVGKAVGQYVSVVSDQSQS
ncbi:dystrophin-like isoform X2 [Watersipora subatra]|uniref:dystrophin-like isoform X2 n=1 Tax=Watersipora subatra TaxID=2589382 RepID=UPI00355B0610